MRSLEAKGNEPEPMTRLLRIRRSAMSSFKVILSSITDDPNDYMAISASGWRPGQAAEVPNARHLRVTRFSDTPKN